MNAHDRTFVARGYTYGLDYSRTGNRAVVEVYEDGRSIGPVYFELTDDTPSPLDVVESDIKNKIGEIAMRLR